MYWWEGGLAEVVVQSEGMQRFLKRALAGEDVETNPGSWHGPNCGAECVWEHRQQLAGGPPQAWSGGRRSVARAHLLHWQPHVCIEGQRAAAVLGGARGGESRCICHPMAPPLASHATLHLFLHPPLAQLPALPPAQARWLSWHPAAWRDRAAAGGSSRLCCRCPAAAVVAVAAAAAAAAALRQSRGPYVVLHATLLAAAAGEPCVAGLGRASQAPPPQQRRRRQDLPGTLQGEPIGAMVRHVINRWWQGTRKGPHRARPSRPGSCGVVELAPRSGRWRVRPRRSDAPPQRLGSFPLCALPPPLTGRRWHRRCLRWQSVDLIALAPFHASPVIPRCV